MRLEKGLHQRMSSTPHHPSTVQTPVLVDGTSVNHLASRPLEPARKGDDIHPQWPGSSPAMSQSPGPGSGQECVVSKMLQGAQHPAALTGNTAGSSSSNNNSGQTQHVRDTASTAGQLCYLPSVAENFQQLQIERPGASAEFQPITISYPLVSTSTQDVRRSTHDPQPSIPQLSAVNGSLQHPSPLVGSLLTFPFNPDGEKCPGPWRIVDPGPGRIVDPGPGRIVDPGPGRIVDPGPGRIVDPGPGRVMDLDPELRFVYQPEANFRFRYLTDAGSHGHLSAALSTSSLRRCPTVQLLNYVGVARLCVRLYTWADDHAHSRPHPILRLQVTEGRDRSRRSQRQQEQLQQQDQQQQREQQGQQHQQSQQEDARQQMSLLQDEVWFPLTEHQQYHCYED
nr:nuclear receptor coactivator 3-like isoform X2 [Cherax quadricarinatus]